MHIQLKTVTALLISVGLTARILAANLPAAPVYEIESKKLKFTAGYRVVAFELSVSNGITRSVEVPAGWKIETFNQASWNSEASGRISIGAAALSVNELCTLFTFVPAIGKKASPKLRINIVMTKDFEHVVTNRNDSVQLKLKQLGRASTNSGK
jgi:hypothetical protein